LYCGCARKVSVSSTLAEFVSVPIKNIPYKH
jgi:hypothetical protein